MVVKVAPNTAPRYSALGRKSFPFDQGGLSRRASEASSHSSLSAGRRIVRSGFRLHLLQTHNTKAPVRWS